MSARTWLKISRPGLWFQTVWLYLLPTSQMRVWDSWEFWVGLVYVTFPLNFLVYGWNDIVDYSVDKANPRKDSWLFGARATPEQLLALPVPLVLVQVPFWGIILRLNYLAGSLTIVGILLTNYLYNDKRIALRGRPPFDLLNPLGYLIVLFLGYWLNDCHLMPWQTILYLALFCLHAHVIGEVMDFYPDKLAGRVTSVGRLGITLSKILIIALLVGEIVLVGFVFKEWVLTGFLLFCIIWLVVDMAWLFKEGSYSLGQFKLMGIAMNLAGYVSISYLWWTGGLLLD
ncbi:MAG: 4-hydroxybenzoate polyprenyltransferase [Kiritimatiellia bacterium]